MFRPPDLLKVLSSEMDPAEIRLVQLAVIKERGAEGFLEKSTRPPSFEIPSKYKNASLF
jgi:hypothetical protein